ncbi:MAG TPA: glycine cleavage T C-terminal barrel domain-containing protein [Terriglobales bacterium]|nr:glycine cleavage T C-terminal barrel domain-containing protein [Terriglobales bacterium]
MSLTTPHNDTPVSTAGGANWPPQFGKATDEFAALKSTCGVYDLAQRAKIRLSGSDRVRWLNGMVTNNIRDLGQNHGVYAFLLNPQGHILGDLVAFNRGESLLVETDHPQLDKILATFDHYIIMDDVEVANISDNFASIGVTGPNGDAVLGAAGIKIPSLEPLQIADLSWHDSPISVIRGEYETYLSYEIWIAPEHASALREALQAAGAMLVGHDAIELYRIALGVPRYGQDIRERDLPQETEQARALNFNKGCYVGQEIVERIRSRGNVHRKFTGFKIDGAAPAPGTKIQAQAKDIGEVTSSAVISTLAGDQTLALGYLRREFATPGKELEIAGAHAIVSDLPFRDLLKT